MSSKFMIAAEDGSLNSISIDYWDSLIPAMVGATSSVCTVSSGTIYSTEYAPWRAFDGIYTNGWVSLSGKTSDYLAVQFRSKRSVGKYTLHARGSEIRACPSSWTFEASNDDFRTYVVLDSQTGMTGWVFGMSKEFVLQNKNSYLSYRINVSGVQAGGPYISIGELELFEYVSPVQTILTSPSENLILSYGMDKGFTVDLNKRVQKKRLASDTLVMAGANKIFKQRIDGAKYPIKKLSTL